MIIKFFLSVLLACDPAFAHLFTPLHPQLGQYEVCVASAAIEDAANAARRDGFQVAGIEELEPLDAFGTSGTYDRSALVRLYGGRRVKVARGWRRKEDGFESVTLVSPHPDAELRRLEPGTMSIFFRVQRFPSTAIVMSPFTTSTDITGSPSPIVVSPNRGPNLSFIVNGMSEVIEPLNVTARMRPLAGGRANRTRSGPLKTRSRIMPPRVSSA